MDVAVSVQYFTPAGSTSQVSTTYTLHSDANGNAYLYGSFAENATVSVKYGNAVLVSYTFGKASEGGKSYVLDATVVSLMSPEEIDAAGQPYKGSSGHNGRQFLGYTFKSVTCGDKTH